ncbi:HSP20 family protein [Lachnospiraceae bacterium PF1-21]
MMLLANRSYNNFFDEMFKSPFFSGAYSNAEAHVMKTDVKEKDGNYMLEVELPGYKKEDVKAEIKDGYLTISAGSKEEKVEKDEEGKILRKERYTGSSRRSFYVGDAITQEDVKANFEDGVLKIEFPKDKEKIEEKAKLIEIK